MEINADEARKYLSKYEKCHYKETKDKLEFVMISIFARSILGYDSLLEFNLSDTVVKHLRKLGYKVEPYLYDGYEISWKRNKTENT